jgi:hypothetical protein
MPLLRGGRPLKRWHWIGVFTPELMLCAAQVRVGPARQSFWAVWDGEQLRGRTRVAGRHGRVEVAPGVLRVHDDDVEIELAVDRDDGVESICADAGQYVWTRKHAGVLARGAVRIGASERTIEGRAAIDETAGYHARRTDWLWSTGVGRTEDGREVAWNLVQGVNDPPRGSERTLWVDGVPREPGPVDFAGGLDRVRFADGSELRFQAQATRARRDNLLLVRSDYECPFGSFSGELEGGVRLLEGVGVMERHSARW